MGHQQESENDGELETEICNPKVDEPSKYKIVLINDDYTPMDFVVEVLKKFFAMDDVTATTIMLQIHNKGQAICGIYNRDVAETKVEKVNNYARLNQYPLLCKMEHD